MLRLGITFDPRELRDLERRISGSLQVLGDRKLLDKVAVFAEQENRRAALAGEDRFGRVMKTWRVRRGDSDYHGEDYRSWTNRTVLIPFGSRSRRIDAFVVRGNRSGQFLGVGYGKAELFVGFTSRAGLVPVWWRKHGRDVLGLNPRTQRGLSLLLRTHSSNAHSLLRRGARRVGTWLGI